MTTIETSCSPRSPFSLVYEVVDVFAARPVDSDITTTQFLWTPLHGNLYKYLYTYGLSNAFCIYVSVHSIITYNIIPQAQPVGLVTKYRR